MSLRSGAAVLASRIARTTHRIQCNGYSCWIGVQWTSWPHCVLLLNKFPWYPSLQSDFPSAPNLLESLALRLHETAKLLYKALHDNIRSYVTATVTQNDHKLSYSLFACTRHTILSIVSIDLCSTFINLVVYLFKIWSNELVGKKH